MDYVTVSAKVSRSVWEKLKRYNVNVSDVIRKAVEDRVREEEIKWALSVMDDVFNRARLRRPSSDIIRMFRDGR